MDFPRNPLDLIKTLVVCFFGFRVLRVVHRVEFAQPIQLRIRSLVTRLQLVVKCLEPLLVKCVCHT
jgi:hypothetical protein